METGTDPMSLPLHALFHCRIVPPGLENVETRPTKKRRSAGESAHFSPGPAEGRLSMHTPSGPMTTVPQQPDPTIWHMNTGCASDHSLHGASGDYHLSGWPQAGTSFVMPSQPLYPPEGQQPAFAGKPNSSRASSWSELSGQMERLPDLSWSIAPSPVDHSTAACSPHPSDWWLAAPPLVGCQNTQDQTLASACQSSSSLPAVPLPSPALDLYDGTAGPRNLDVGSSLLLVQPSYGPGVPDSFPGLRSFEGGAPLVNIPTPRFQQIGADCTATSRPVGHHELESTALLLQVSDPLLIGPDVSPATPQEAWSKREDSTKTLPDGWGAGKTGVGVSRDLAVTAKEPSTRGDNVHGGQPLDRKRRARFDEGLRKETSNTRTMGACMRCHNQRVRCIPNKLDKSSPIAPCETCLKVRRDSKKTIHNIPCLRFKITSIVICRPGGLELTRRFDHTKVINVTDFSDNVIQSVEITQGLCRHPLRLSVRRFQPRDGDVLHRKYMDGKVPKQQHIAPFCLADIETTARDFQRYLACNALEALGGAVRNSDGLVKDVFGMIASYYNSLPERIKTESGEGIRGVEKSVDQKEFLRKLIHLWFAMRHEIGSAWLSGEEQLGMSPECGANLPLPNRVSVSRMIVAQFDSIRHERVYKKLVPDVLRTFHSFLASCNKEAWFTVFLGTFLLLHQVASTSQDRYRYARQNCQGKPLDTRYGNLDERLTAFVEDVHHGAVMLLAHWQYFKRCDLMTIDWDDLSDSPLMFLEPHQVAFVKKTVGRLRTKLDSIPATPSQGCWEHELFWISKMFLSETSQEAGWTPPETFTRAKPSVGRE